MGLPNNKIIDATKQNDILHRTNSKGRYEVEKVTETIKAMNDIKEKGKYILDQEKLDKININFLSSKMSEDEVLKTIEEVHKKFNVVLDPHSAIGYGAFDKVNISGHNIVLATAHPCKFPDAIKNAINFNAELPKELMYILNEKENYEIIDNDIVKVKKHIKERI